MSYSCSISFKQMDPKDIYPFLMEMKAFLLKKENMEANAKENYIFCPLIRKHPFDVVKKLSDAPVEEIYASQDWAAHHIFKYRWFYDAERGQLGIYGLPDCGHALFDGTVYFQNSCDQDYTREEYKGIKLFEDIYDKWTSANEEEFVAMYEKTFGTKFDREYMNDALPDEELYKERLLYCQRSAAYDEIWEPIADTLYNDRKALYIGLVDSSEITILRSFVVMCHREQMAFEAEWEKENAKSADKEKEIKIPTTEEER